MRFYLTVILYFPVQSFRINLGKNVLENYDFEFEKNDKDKNKLKTNWTHAFECWFRTFPQNYKIYTDYKLELSMVLAI